MKSHSLRLALALLAALAGDAVAATPAGSNVPGMNASVSEAPKFIRAVEDSAAGSRKSKAAAGSIGSPVNNAGAKGATLAASRGGRVFLTRSQSSAAPAGAESRDREKSAADRTPARNLVAMKSEKPGRKSPARDPGVNWNDAEAIASTAKPATASQPPAVAESLISSPPASPRIEFGGSAPETTAVAPPAMNATAPLGQSPGADASVESREPALRTDEPAPLAGALSLLPGSGAGGLGALNPAGAPAPLVVAALPGAARGGAASRNAILPWYYALAALLAFVIASYCFYGFEKTPWLSYTEDWVDGFLWRWEWRRSEVANVRGFCPTCRTEVILRPVAAVKNAAPMPEPPGTWAFCPKCKEATCLDMRDVPAVVARAVTLKRNSGDYRESVATSKRKAGIASDRTVRVKVIEGRVL